MKLFLVILTGLCLALYCYLGYIGAVVEAWSVIPWIAFAFIDHCQNYRKQT